MTEEQEKRLIRLAFDCTRAILEGLDTITVSKDGPKRVPGFPRGELLSVGATIPATDPADAAEGWAEWHDRSSAEYRIASGREEIVIVRDVETGEQREWIVRGEAMPYYTAQPGESATIRAQVAPSRWEDVPRRSEANK